MSVANDVRYLAARILGKSDDQDAVTALVETLDDPDPELVRTRILSLAAIASRDRANQDANKEGYLTRRYSPRAFMAFHTGMRLLPMLNSENRDMRLAVVRALGAIGQGIGRDEIGSGAIEPGDAEPETMDNIADNRHAAVSGPIIMALLARLEDNDITVRIEAIRSASVLGVDARTQSRTSQGAIHQSQIEHLVGRFKDMLQAPETSVRIAVARGIAHLLQHTDTKNTSALTQDMMPDTMDALVHTGFLGTGDEVREIARVMKHLDPRQATIRVLARLGALSNSAERRFAIEMLEEILK